VPRQLATTENRIIFLRVITKDFTTLCIAFGVAEFVAQNLLFSLTLFDALFAPHLRIGNALIAFCKELNRGCASRACRSGDRGCRRGNAIREPRPRTPVRACIMTRLTHSHLPVRSSVARLRYAHSFLVLVISTWSDAGGIKLTRIFSIRTHIPPIVTVVVAAVMRCVGVRPHVQSVRVTPGSELTVAAMATIAVLTSAAHTDLDLVVRTPSARLTALVF